jgi:hypothetical protein
MQKRAKGFEYRYFFWYSGCNERIPGESRLSLHQYRLIMWDTSDLNMSNERNRREIVPSADEYCIGELAQPSNGKGAIARTLAACSASTSDRLVIPGK